MERISDGSVVESIFRLIRFILLCLPFYQISLPYRLFFHSHILLLILRCLDVPVDVVSMTVVS